MDENIIREAIQRVTEMEMLFNKLSMIYEDTPNLLTSSEASEMKKTLSEYLSRGKWLHDYELDEQKLLPRDLKRGVLSEDGLYNLLCEIEEEIA